jgi:SAM-dependent methyltransferase
MSCPICGATDFWGIPFNRDAQIESWRMQLGDNAAYDWRLCRRCGNAYPSRQPDLRVLERVWAANRGDEGLPPDERERVWVHRRTISRAGAARSLRLFAPFAGGRPGRFLDIACGLGETVRLFAEHGWDAQGIDADPSTEPSHRQLGIRARIGQFEHLDIGEGFNLIHIAHAIYFITDPMSFIRTMRARLAPQGLFCVVLADFMANADAGLPSYAHTFCPTASSMRYALALAGFEVVLSKSRASSIFMAARPVTAPAIPRVSPAAIRLLYRTKTLRHAAFGRPYLALRRTAKTLLQRSS